MNESIFLVTMLVDFAFILLAIRMGKSGLIGTMVANLILVSTFGAKIITIFGLQTNAGNVYYACIFLALNIINEHFRKNDSKNAIFVGFLGLILFIIMGQLTINYSVIQSDSISSAAETLFDAVPRIAFASIFSYLVVSFVNVEFYDFLHRRYGKQFLWVRNIASQILAQSLDSLLFFTIAFYGSLPLNIVLESMIVGFVLKSIVSVLGTPIIYLSYIVKEQPVSNITDGRLR